MFRKAMQDVVPPLFNRIVGRRLVVCRNEARAVAEQHVHHLDEAAAAISTFADIQHFVINHHMARAPEEGGGGARGGEKSSLPPGETSYVEASLQLPFGQPLQWPQLARLETVIRSGASLTWAAKACGHSSGKSGGAAADGEVYPGIVMFGVVKKTSGLSTKRRTLVLTTGGELVYVERERERDRERDRETCFEYVFL